MNQVQPPRPVHVPGTNKGEELVHKQGREPGRAGTGKSPYRLARDSTSINAADREPIDPRSPRLPPA
jgi:hypothetical protein